MLLCPVQHGAIGAKGGSGPFAEGGIWAFVASGTPAPVLLSQRLGDMLRICERHRIKTAGRAFVVVEGLAPAIEQSPAPILSSLSRREGMLRTIVGFEDGSG